MSPLAADEPAKPLYDQIQHGRLRATIYPTVLNGKPDYGCECFRWYKPSKRSSWKKVHRYNHGRGDLHAVARCLEDAHQWIVQAKGLVIPPDPLADEDAPRPDDEVGLSVQEVLAALHQTTLFRACDPESAALEDYENDLRAALEVFSPAERREALATYHETPLYRAIEGLRKHFRPAVFPSTGPAA